MANPVDEYLARLRQRLAKRLPSPMVEDHIKEISAHLKADADNRIQRGEKDAEVAAVRSFGSDFLVADSLLRAHSGVGERSVWRLAWLPCVLLLAYYLLTVTFFGAGNAFAEYAERWLPALYISSFSLVCLYSRRIVIKPILATFAIVVVLLFTEAAIFGPFGVTPVAAARRQTIARNTQSKVRRLTSELQMAHGDPTATYPTELRKGGAFLAPVRTSEAKYATSPDMSPDELPFYQLVPQTSEEQARSLWQSLTPARIKDIGNQLQVTKANLALWKDPDTMLRETTGYLVLWLIPMLYPFIAINLLALVAIEARRRLTSAAWNRRRWA